tara:strand:+ start:244 stop:510 length:267 start_codon:yes stop_codon:yes gene_type:complete
MKITKTQLKQIIKEELEEGLGDFSSRMALTRGIRDAIVGYLEERQVFGDLGGIPRHTIQKIENSALVVADAVLDSKMETDNENYKVST